MALKKGKPKNEAQRKKSSAAKPPRILVSKF